VVRQACGDQVHVVELVRVVRLDFRAQRQLAEFVRRAAAVSAAARNTKRMVL